MKKKKTDRSQVKNPGLNKHYNSKIRQEYIDYDYVNKLTPEEKELLNKFSEEYYGAALDFDNLENNMHNTPELKKACTDSNNARNRCMYGRAKAQNQLLDNNNITLIDESINIDIDVENDYKKEEGSNPELETFLIDYLDSKKLK